MSAEEQRAVTATLSAWEALRICLWSKINEELKRIGSQARLRDGKKFPKPPAGITLASAISAFRVAVRGFALHIDLDVDRHPWLCIGHNTVLTMAGHLTFGNRLEHFVGRLFDDWARCNPGDRFFRDVVVKPTMRHADATRSRLREFIAMASLNAPKNRKDLDRLRAAIKKLRVGAKPDAIIKEAEISAQKGRNLLRVLQDLGEYEGFARGRPGRYNSIQSSEG